MVSGNRTGSVTDMDTIAVFWPGLEEWQNAVVVGQAELRIRYWPKKPIVNADSSTLDPTRLEDVGVGLAAFFQTKQTSYSATGVWFCRLVSVLPDYYPDEWGVEARLFAQFDNPAVIP